MARRMRFGATGKIAPRVGVRGAVRRSVRQTLKRFSVYAR